jgi:hypothetical protein
MSVDHRVNAGYQGNALWNLFDKIQALAFCGPFMLKIGGEILLGKGNQSTSIITWCWVFKRDAIYMEKLSHRKLVMER